MKLFKKRQHETFAVLDNFTSKPIESRNSSIVIASRLISSGPVSKPAAEAPTPVGIQKERMSTREREDDKGREREKRERVKRDRKS